MVHRLGTRRGKFWALTSLNHRKSVSSTPGGTGAALVRLRGCTAVLVCLFNFSILFGTRTKLLTDSRLSLSTLSFNLDDSLIPHLCFVDDYHSFAVASTSWLYNYGRFNWEINPLIIRQRVLST